MDLCGAGGRSCQKALREGWVRGRDAEEVESVREGVGRELRWGGGEIVAGGERAAAKRML